MRARGRGPHSMEAKEPMLIPANRGDRLAPLVREGRAPRPVSGPGRPSRETHGLPRPRAMPSGAGAAGRAGASC